jgi:hypothetical protein
MRPYQVPFRALLALIVSAPGLAACGGDDGQGTPEKSDAADPAASGDVGSAGDANTGDRALGAPEAGEAAADSTSQEAESGIDAGAGDSGGLPCGDASCVPGEICLYPACGCAAGGGPCPPPSCVSPPAGAGSYDCSPGGVETPACGTVNVPIPSTCSRVCHEICA